MTQTIPEIAFGGRAVGPGHPVLVVAELSANHNQDLERAFSLVHAANRAGADAVKTQAYTAASMVWPDSGGSRTIGPEFVWSGRQLYELYEEAHTPWEWHQPVKELAESLGLLFLSSAFDRESVTFLDELGVAAIKIASPELVDLDLIKIAAATGRPLILSTGMAVAAEVDEAVIAARIAGAKDVILLRCNSSYPALLSEMDLRTLPDMSARWNVHVGLSDHTEGYEAATAAVAAGALVIEKHLTMDPEDGGPDSVFSADPDGFTEFVSAIRRTEAAMGRVRYGPSAHEEATLQFRRSLWVVEKVSKGERLRLEQIRSLRPADGLAPRELEMVLNRVAAVDIAAGTPLTWDLLGD